MTKAINVTPQMFGGRLRAGDLLACCNLLEWFRPQADVLSNLQLYIPNESVFDSEHCRQMRDFLIEHTDYLTMEPKEFIEYHNVPGTDPTYPNIVNLWNIRSDVLIRRQNVFDIPDAVKIDNSMCIWKNKIVIVPLMDADYNISRNWSLELLQSIIDSYKNNNDYEKILISKNIISGLELRGFEYSFDYVQNIYHIMECQNYHGGDTGLSHLAGALTERPFCQFYYPHDTYGTTNPFGWKTSGNMIYY